jgi:hypothetical protein
MHLSPCYSVPTRARFDPADRLSSIRLREQRADPAGDFFGYDTAPAPGTHEELETALELRVIHARRTAAQVFLDLDAHGALELSVQVELDLLQRFTTVDR